MKLVVGEDGWYTIADHFVEQIGETEYMSLADAIAAADTGDTVEILVGGTYKLPNIPKNITIRGATDGVVFDCVGSGSICSVPNGATFENATFNMGQSNYHGFQHAGTINMNGCTINGLFFSYGDMNFTDCEFVQTASDYMMWAYSGNLTYTDCNFNGSGKFINVYNEGNDGGTPWTVTASDCTFNSDVTNKAAFNVKETCGSKLLKYNVSISNCTATGSFPEAKEDGALLVISPLVQVDDRLLDDSSESAIAVNVEGKQVYPIKTYVAQIGETKYATLAEAIQNAQDNDVIELLWVEGDTPIDMQGSVFGKTVTITGTAQVDWSKGWLFVGRGGEGDGKLIFDHANLTTQNDNDSAPKSTGIQVSGREKDTTNKYDGTLIVRDSSIVLDYLINRGTVEVIGGGTVGETPDLVVKGGFGIAGRPANETESGESATATIDLKDGAYVKILNPNGMGVGCASGSPEGFGVMNIDAASKVETVTSELKVYANVGTLNSSGNIFGNFIAEENATVSITGGTYTFDPTDYVAEGFEATDNDDGTWTVVEKAVGNIDGIGEVTAADLTLLLRHLAGISQLTEEQLALADVDDIEGVTASDATVLARMIADSESHMSGE